jgi:hypothetical protein
MGVSEALMGLVILKIDALKIYVYKGAMLENLCV